MAEDNQTSDFGPLENSEGGRDGDVDVGGLMEREDFESAVCNYLILHQALATPPSLLHWSPVRTCTLLKSKSLDLDALRCVPSPS
jgi:hypothetical protein